MERTPKVFGQITCISALTFTFLCRRPACQKVDCRRMDTGGHSAKHMLWSGDRNGLLGVIIL